MAMGKISPDGGYGEDGHLAVPGPAVHRVEEERPLLRVDEGPQALGLLG